MATVDLAVKHQTRQRTEPWIGVGTSGYWNDINEALYDCGLDFNVSAQEAYIDIPSTSLAQALQTMNSPANAIVTTRKQVPDIKVNVRDDTNEIVGVVSDRYGIVQNSEAFTLLQPFLNAGGEIIQGGMTEQGMCFMVCKVSEMSILDNEFTFYVCAINSFNSKYPLAVFMTPVRVVCQNMFRKLMKGNDHVLHIKHGANVSNRLLEANQASSIITTYMSDFSNTLNVANKTLAYPHTLIEKLFPYPPKNMVKNWDASVAKVDEMRDLFYEEYYMAQDNIRFEGTAYGFINAYYDYLTHRPEARSISGKWEDRRLTGLLSGTDVNTKILSEIV